MKAKDYPERIPRYILGMPIIYSLIVPVVVLDIWLEVYHRVCFPLYGLEYVPRSEYIRIDRQKLSYLTRWEKLNCMYCSYINGLLGYAVRIAGDTERFWCGIKHKQGGNFQSPDHHKDFVAYGDKQTFEELYRRPKA